MNLNEAVANYVKEFTFVEPGPSALQALQKAKRRTFNMGDLPWLEGVCAWCEKKPVKSKRAKYCSDTCTESAVIYCNPQSNVSKGYRFVRLQECVCKMCGECFEDEVIAIMKHQYDHRQRMRQYGYYTAMSEKISYYEVIANHGFKWQLDHIIPIFKGGATVDPNNLQVICESCHRRKTAEEKKCVK